MESSSKFIHPPQNQNGLHRKLNTRNPHFLIDFRTLRSNMKSNINFKSQTFGDISNTSSSSPIRSVLNCRLESRKAAYSRESCSARGTKKFSNFCEAIENFISVKSNMDNITRNRVVEAKSPSWRRDPWPPNSSSSTFNITE